jgi:hypothetical protein
MATDLAQAARDFIERTLRDNYVARWRACQAGEDEPDERPFERHRLTWEKRRENQLGLPEGVFEAYDTYHEAFDEEDIGGTSVIKFPLPGQEVYLIRVTTDGDDTWMEVYDDKGEFLAAARAYLEVTAWGSRDWLRGQLESTATLPPELKDASQRTLWGKPLPE